MNTPDDLDAHLLYLATLHRVEGSPFNLGREFNHLPWNVRRRLSIEAGFLAVETLAADMLVVSLTADQRDRIRRGMAFVYEESGR